MKRIILIMLLPLAFFQISLAACGKDLTVQNEYPNPPADIESSSVKLPKLIGDNMVLQRNATVSLWGWASAGEVVSINASWENISHSATTGSDGKWQLEISTPDAGGPWMLTFSDSKGKITVKNVLTGDVWFCCGQSNMEMPLKGYKYLPVKGGLEAISMARTDMPIRIYNDNMLKGKWNVRYSKVPESDTETSWEECSSAALTDLSAVAYWFGEYLQKALNVPIGIISSSIGGSRVEAWMSRKAVSSFPEFDLSILDNNEKIDNAKITPCVLYNSKVAPFLKFAIKGIIWYQGESNHYKPQLYSRTFPAFVADLREGWGKADLPFYYVETAPYCYENPDATLGVQIREVQWKSMPKIPYSGVVTTMDLGEKNNIHPDNKKPVSERLAMLALARTYGRTGFTYMPPVYKSIEIKDGKVYVDFDYAEMGLKPRNIELDGFEIAGSDKVFHPATAKITGSPYRLVVSSEDVPSPVAVRYAFRNWAEPSFFNIYGLPVPSFRTDDWKL